MNVQSSADNGTEIFGYSVKRTAENTVKRLNFSFIKIAILCQMSAGKMQRYVTMLVAMVMTSSMTCQTATLHSPASAAGPLQYSQLLKGNSHRTLFTARHGSKSRNNKRK